MAEKTIYARMAEVFQEAGVPGFLNEWRATPSYPRIPDHYATYRVPLDEDTICADDMEIIHRTDVDIDFYSKSDPSLWIDSIEKALLAQGFLVERQRGMDDYRHGDFLYHRRIEAVLYSEV